jgi:ABC-2 type transport system permease protein
MTVDRTSGLSSQPWAVVAAHELRNLWLSAKGLTVLLAYTVLLSAMAYLAATNSELNLLDARESISIIVQVAIGLGTLAALVVSADAISGERERDTLEALLLTPVPRRDLVIGKMLAASSMWVASIVVALPYIVSVAQGPAVGVDAVLVLVTVGPLVGAALTALGMALSAVSMSNRVSLAASIGALLVLAAPSQLPAVASRGGLGSILIAVNPVTAGMKLASSVLVDQKTWMSQWTLIVSPVISAIALTVIAVLASRWVRLGGAR